MRKTWITLGVILGLAAVLAGISLLVRPDWLDIPGGWLILAGAALLATIGLGSGLKNWRDFLFPTPVKRDPEHQEKSRQSQEADHSPGAEQEMHGQGGIQKQKSTYSPDSRQKMD